MNDTLHPVGRSEASLDSVEWLCCSNGCWDAATIPSVVAMRLDFACVWPVEWLDDATIVLVVQAYLRRRRAGLPTRRAMSRLGTTSTGYIPPWCDAPSLHPVAMLRRHLIKRS